MKLTRVGVDLAKQVFQVHGVDRAERPVWCQRPTLALPVLASRKAAIVSPAANSIWRPVCTADAGLNRLPSTPRARERARAKRLARDAELIHRADMPAVN
jgi:hypothetical protein